jgi:hypothetical protein
MRHNCVIEVTLPHGLLGVILDPSFIGDQLSGVGQVVVIHGFRGHDLFHLWSLTGLTAFFVNGFRWQLLH